MANKTVKTFNIEVKVTESSEDGTIKDIQSNNITIPINIVTSPQEVIVAEDNDQMLHQHIGALFDNGDDTQSEYDSESLDNTGELEDSGGDFFNDNDVVYNNEADQYYRYDESIGEFVEIDEKEVNLNDRLISLADPEPEPVYKLIDGNLCLLDTYFDDVEPDAQYTHYKGSVYKLIEPNPSKEIVECITAIEENKSKLKELLGSGEIENQIKKEEMQFELPSRYKTIH